MNPQDSPKNALEHLLKEAALDPAKRTKFFKALPDAEVYVLGRTRGMGVAEGDGAVRATGGLSVQFTVFTRDEGQRFVAAFSSVERLKEALEPHADSGVDTGYIRMNCRSFLELAPEGCEVLLNGGSTYGVALEPAQVQQILAGEVGPKTRELSAGSAVDVEPFGNPGLEKTLVAALKPWLKARAGSVTEVCLATLANSASDGRPARRTPTLGIAAPGLSERHFEELVDEISSLLGDTLESDYVLDVIRLDGQQKGLASGMKSIGRRLTAATEE